MDTLPKCPDHPGSGCIINFPDMLLMVQKSGDHHLSSPEMYETECKDMAYLPYQLVSRISEPSTVRHF